MSAYLTIILEMVVVVHYLYCSGHVLYFQHVDSPPAPSLHAYTHYAHAKALSISTNMSGTKQTISVASGSEIVN